MSHRVTREPAVGIEPTTAHIIDACGPSGEPSVQRGAEAAPSLRYTPELASLLSGVPNRRPTAAVLRRRQASIRRTDRAELFHVRQTRKRRAAEFMQLLQLCGLLPERSTRRSSCR